MADVVTTTVIRNERGRYTVHFTGISDGTGESAVQKIDVSTLTSASGGAGNYLSLKYAHGNVSGTGYVQALWDATTDVPAFVASGPFSHDWSMEGGLTDPKATGYTGDLRFTTVGMASGDVYDITLHCWVK